ncbi:MAG: DUF4920 domain-containing protein [Chromatiales bacterium]|jgi:hypothetical protein|nr:DUF4920 domain-containing protein [Chromatiales bacterium]MDH3894295.1 DUF4920 domain-containing protein [Chromatiales bacterium]MDH3945904.1 DUF4920 domain-containing protein [Chromatiales bacterium]PLX57715.1 MAG: DUF4920 domain-containing protein [Chromatiales bacterium]
MKKICIVALTVFFSLPAWAADPAPIRLSEPVASTADYEVFGAPVGALDSDVSKARSLGEIIANADQHNGEQVLVKASVAKVCQKKGCFFIARDGNNVARITFVDYSFFVPTDSGGKTVTIVGTFSKNVLSEKKARHFAEDAGADPMKISGPQAEYGIVATTVIIPKG